MSVLDKDGDGLIDFDEFVGLFESVAKNAADVAGAAAVHAAGEQHEVS